MKQDVISEGERSAVGQAAMLGLSLVEGKAILAGLQRVLVTARTDAHCHSRRRCSHCKAQRPLKDHRPRQLVSLFGVVAVRAPRFGPSRCGMACRRSLTPVAEIMPDRCTLEYERVLAGLGSALPYRQAQALLAELLPLNTAPEVETGGACPAGRGLAEADGGDHAGHRRGARDVGADHTAAAPYARRPFRRPA